MLWGSRLRSHRRSGLQQAMTRIETATRAASLCTSAAARAAEGSCGLHWHWPMLLIWAMPLLAVCGQSDGVRKAEADRLSALGAPKIDACQVLTKDEIETVQGDSVEDRKSTRLNSSHVATSYAVFCLKKKKHRYP